MDTLENNGAGRSGHSKRIENLGIPKKKYLIQKCGKKKATGMIGIYLQMTHV
jgi:hypothetical protein